MTLDSGWHSILIAQLAAAGEMSSGLRAWYRSDTLALAGIPNGAAISSWASSIGGTALAQSTTGQQPTLVTNAYNGKAAVRFDGSNDYLTTGAVSTIAQPLTVLLVGKLLSTSGTPAFFADATGAVFVDSDTNWRIYAGSAVAGSASDTSLHVFALTFDGASSKLRVDGGAGTTGDPGASSLNGITIGSRAGGSLPANCDICELLVFGESLDLTSLNRHGKALARAYGTTWTTAT